MWPSEYGSRRAPCRSGGEQPRAADSPQRFRGRLASLRCGWRRYETKHRLSPRGPPRRNVGAQVRSEHTAQRLTNLAPAGHAPPNAVQHRPRLSQQCRAGARNPRGTRGPGRRARTPAGRAAASGSLPRDLEVLLDPAPPRARLDPTSAPSLRPSAHPQSATPTLPRLGGNLATSSPIGLAREGAGVLLPDRFAAQGRETVRARLGPNPARQAWDNDASRKGGTVAGRCSHTRSPGGTRGAGRGGGQAGPRREASPPFSGAWLAALTLHSHRSRAGEAATEGALPSLGQHLLDVEGLLRSLGRVCHGGAAWIRRGGENGARPNVERQRESQSWLCTSLELGSPEVLACVPTPESNTRRTFWPTLGHRAAGRHLAAAAGAGSVGVSSSALPGFLSAVLDSAARGGAAARGWRWRARAARERRRTPRQPSSRNRGTSSRPPPLAVTAGSSEMKAPRWCSSLPRRGREATGRRGL